MDFEGEKVATIETSEKNLPSGMISALTSALCTCSLAMAGRSIKAFWKGWAQAPHVFVKSVQSKTLRDRVTQCIVRGRSIVMSRRTANCYTATRGNVLVNYLLTAMMKEGKWKGEVEHLTSYIDAPPREVKRFFIFSFNFFPHHQSTQILYSYVSLKYASSRARQ